MKQLTIVMGIAVSLCFFACNKASVDSQISLTASASQLSVGDTLTVTLTSSAANASNWTVTPSSTATKTYSLTTSKVNYFSFSQPGSYIISVRAKHIDYDSTRQQLPNAWNEGGGNRGSCTRGVDTASVAVTVTK